MPRNRNDRPDPRMNGRRDYDEDDRRKKNGMNMKKIFGISFCIVLGIVVISGAVIYRLGHDMYSSINYVADEDVRTVETLPEAAMEETLSTEERVGEVVSDEELNSIHSAMSSLSEIETVSDDDIYNVLLVGVDRRDDSCFY